MTYRTINPETLGAPRGYNHGMLAARPLGADGRLLFVAGQTALDPSTGRIVPGGVAAQWERALQNALEVVAAAGGGPEDVGRLTIYVTDRAEYLENLRAIGAAYRSVMGGHYPAIALVEVSGLVDEGAVVEVEATAIVPGPEAAAPADG